MATMSVTDALAAVLEDIKRLSAEELRLELDTHRNGDVATALREVRSYLLDQFIAFHFPLGQIDCLFSDMASVDDTQRAVSALDAWVASNGEKYALAA